MLDASTAASRTLRPLGLGEILDRGVTLCVSNFILLFSLYAAIIVPLQVLAFFAAPDQSAFFDILLKGLQHGGKIDQQALQAALTNQPRLGPLYFVSVVLTLFGSLLVQAALMYAVAAIYRGQPVTFAQAFGAGLRLWPAIILISLVYLVFLVIYYVVAVVIILIAVFALTAITLALHSVHALELVAGAVDVIVGLALFGAFIALLLVGELAWYLGCFSIVVERAGFIVAAVSGLRRVFRGFRRSLLAALAIGIVILGLLLVMGLGAGLLAVFAGGSRIVGLAFQVLLSTMIGIFVTTVAGIFYFDLRVREEGLDLEVESAGIAPLPVF